MRRLTWNEWEERRKDAQRRLAQIARTFPRPYRRERPRDPDEARLLRERGTPKHLIAPDREPRS